MDRRGGVNDESDKSHLVLNEIFDSEACEQCATCQVTLAVTLAAMCHKPNESRQLELLQVEHTMPVVSLSFG